MSQQPPRHPQMTPLLPPPLPSPPPPVIGYATPMPPPPQEFTPEMRMMLPVGRSGWAIAAGYLGLFAVVVFPAPIALIISIIAIRDLKRHPELHGWGRAIFGLVMGILFSLPLLFMLIAFTVGKR